MICRAAAALRLTAALRQLVRLESNFGLALRSEDVTMAMKKKHLYARLMGDDRYESKIYLQAPGTVERPNVIVSSVSHRVVGCLCSPDEAQAKYMVLEKGKNKQCACGYWFQLVDDLPEPF
uniref:Cytochrome c oxidase subunit 5B, mitochondrial n=1 Tax=Trichuris muris TaxID=70415 RepID=A0A5S6QUS2_TRIMR